MSFQQPAPVHGSIPLLQKTAMENTKMRIDCWKIKDGKEIPMPPPTTLDGFEWNGRIRLRVTDDDGSLGLPFVFAGEDSAIMTVVKTEQDGKQSDNKKIKQTLRCVPRSLGCEIICSRTRSYNGKEHVWSEWEQVSKGGDSGNEVTWGNSSHVDTYTTAGIYNIKGERTNAADGLPIANSNPGHTISARLVVLDSSISGTGKDTDKCVTQILTLSNRVGGDGDVYVRTGRAASTNVLVGGNGWEPWGKLQQNIGVGQVTSLNNYIDNGMYSGVYTDGSTFFETFVMVVINNYAVAGATGGVRSVSQFKYTLNLDGTFSYKTRTGQGNTGISWGNWVDIGAATTADIQDNSITAQKLCVDVREKVNNPLRPLFIAAGAEYNDSGADKTKTAPWGETVIHKAGHYYLNGLGDITEEQMMEIYKYTFPLLGAVDWSNALRDVDIRTNLFYNQIYATQRVKVFKASFYNSNIEILCFNNSGNDTIKVSLSDSLALSHAFTNTKKLKRIIGIFDLGMISAENAKNVGSGCNSLVEARLYGIKGDLLLFNAAVNINKSSILYAIENAQPSSAMTITLHPDAYARLKDDAEIVAALEAQPLVSLVSA